jgi:hypothetical protein
MRVEPCTIEHLVRIRPQARQLAASAAIDECTKCLQLGPGWVLVDETGPRAAAGFCPDGTGSAWAWALLGEIGPRGLVAMHKALQASPFSEVVTLVDPTWPQAVRWARLLGFISLGPAPIAGHDYWGWCRG